MRIFNLSKEYNVVCNSESTRYGFRHLAVLHKNGFNIARDKICYYNRTWEKFEFESVLNKVINSYFDEKQAKKYIKKLKSPENEQFKAVSLVCKLGEVICEKQKDKNKWKKQMLNTIKGIDFPEDFNNLPEAEKTRRLNGAINTINKDI